MWEMIKKIKTRNKKIKIGRTRKMRGGWQCSYAYPVCDLQDGWCYNTNNTEQSSEDNNGINHNIWQDETCSMNNLQWSDENIAAQGKQKIDDTKHTQPVIEEEQPVIKENHVAEYNKRVREKQQRLEQQKRLREEQRLEQQERLREEQRLRDEKISATFNTHYEKYRKDMDNIIEACEKKFNSEIRQIDKYTNECKNSNWRSNCILGEGGFGKVIFYKCNEGSDIAFKIHKRSKELIDSKEIEILKKLNNLYNVINLYNDYEFNNYYIVSFEAINGFTLTDYVSSNFPHPKYDTEILYQLIYTMIHIHKYNILHLDIKPDNIMIDTTIIPYRVVYIDFGLSLSVSSIYTTTYNTPMGTLLFMHPHAFNGKYSGIVDLWALGITIAHMFISEETLMVIYNQSIETIKTGIIGKKVNKYMTNYFRENSPKWQYYFVNGNFWDAFINYDNFKEVYINFTENLNVLNFISNPSPPARSNRNSRNPWHAIQKKGVIGAIKGLMPRGGKFKQSIKKRKNKKSFKRRKNKKSSKKRKLNKKSIRKRKSNKKKLIKNNKN